MNLFFRRLIIAICLLCIGWPLSFADDLRKVEPVRIGVLAFRPKPQTPKFAPLAPCLGYKRRIHYIALSRMPTF